MDVRTDIRRKSVKPNPVEYPVDLVFGPEDDNRTVFESCAKEAVELGLRGAVANLLAYGQTGSGKTHTIFGLMSPLAELIENDDLWRKKTFDTEEVLENVRAVWRSMHRSFGQRKWR